MLSLYLVEPTGLVVLCEKLPGRLKHAKHMTGKPECVETLATDCSLQQACRDKHIVTEY